MKITQSMVDLMKAFSIAAMCKNSINELRELYKAGLMELGKLSKEETMYPEQACSVTEFFMEVIKKEESRIENAVSASEKIN